MKIINIWFCWLRGFWWTIKIKAPFKGHVILIEEENVPAYLTIGKCKYCGKYDCTWKRM